CRGRSCTRRSRLSLSIFWNPTRSPSMHRVRSAGSTIRSLPGGTWPVKTCGSDEGGNFLCRHEGEGSLRDSVGVNPNRRSGTGRPSEQGLRGDIHQRFLRHSGSKEADPGCLSTVRSPGKAPLEIQPLSWRLIYTVTGDGGTIAVVIEW